ncbi:MULTISPECIES: XTP/dITP diphosphatase [Pseudoalteromonas]|jgi:XTP/dITP diphosphohydrolase|uniref:dITP/XTP pyrophosphatase n=2 Tax=Pseudoalteromonas agarivorans TaxID=176102 RepID=A0AAD0TYQ2_9GAMM|nr:MULTISPECIES: XTP/dITP diphosphatase [Pseudoalteromonas]MDY6886299.1 XTP/dITP diphosphatase [Pseudomonadota bacterium]ATC81172.1 XTP/dITP diphosphohydrolase [Pseudoalteromonas agarivorans DSM 14585]AYM85652.1 XTP/dITP diphosphatase [Pseudoalteromonas agarivorans]KPW01413.1 dITP/XTP pyrophosphatase [Pseudoalteromonas sp. P1-11]MCK8094620.1 XTP/dITP diphosphatase [Pseudoalteromonas sp. 1CM17D]|tara:strand:+ start:2592 stop:3191 length:600 start_codon:yes stop_codon:yes gene_type:complete
MTKTLVLATGNPGKVNELANMLSPLNINVLPQSDFNVGEVAETGTTFVENAIIKARHAAKITGMPAIADDSGLEVDGLNGAPGVYSARFAGESASDQDNIDKLLNELADNPNRKARFWCVLVLMRHADDPTPLICSASWEGEITQTQNGEGGFGYDPVFFVAEQNCTSAELTKEQKNAVSHRGQALKKLLLELQSKGGL